MKARYPYQYYTGATLGPALLVSNIRRLQADVNDAIAHRYHYSTFTLDWSLCSSAGQPVFTYRFQTPFAFDIVRTELVYYATNVTTIDAAAPNGTVSVTSGGTGVRSLDSIETPYHVAANDTLDFSITVTGGAWVLDDCRMTVTIRTDRGATSGTFDPWLLNEATLPRTGVASSVANLNAEFARGASSATASAANRESLRIEVRAVVASGAGALIANRGTYRVPGTARRLANLQLGLYSAATSAWQVTVTFPSGPATTTRSLTGVGAGTLALSSVFTENKTQALNDPTLIADDSVITLSRASGTDASRGFYVVFFWG